MIIYLARRISQGYLILPIIEIIRKLSSKPKNDTFTYTQGEAGFH